MTRTVSPFTYLENLEVFTTQRLIFIIKKIVTTLTVIENFTIYEIHWLIYPPENRTVQYSLADSSYQEQNQLLLIWRIWQSPIVTAQFMIPKTDPTFTISWTWIILQSPIFIGRFIILMFKTNRTIYHTDNSFHFYFLWQFSLIFTAFSSYQQQLTLLLTWMIIKSPIFTSGNIYNFSLPFYIIFSCLLADLSKQEFSFPH